MARGNLIGYYRGSKLIEVFSKTRDAADYFKVSYDVLIRSLGKKPELKLFLKKNEDVRKIHANTYYGFYAGKFESYIKSKTELKHGCDECLKKNNLAIAYNDKFQQYGLCGYCNSNKDVSIGALNNWLRKEGILLDKRSHREILALLPRPILKKEVPERPFPKIKKKAKKKKSKKSKTVFSTVKNKSERDIITPINEEPIAIKETAAKKEKSSLSGTSLLKIMSWTGIILLAIFYLPDVFSRIEPAEKKDEVFTIPKFEPYENDVKTARAILLSKFMSESGDKLMRYRNTDNMEWTIYDAEGYWDEVDVGDSLKITFKVDSGTIALIGLEKIVY